MNPNLPGETATTPTSSPGNVFSPGSANSPSSASSALPSQSTGGSQIPGMSALPQRARETVQHTQEALKHTYDNARHRAEDTLARTQVYVRKNPMPVILGALAFGALVGYSLATSRREEDFRTRFTHDPLQTIRDTVAAALIPAGDRIHDAYDSARDGASKVFNRAHHRADSWSDHLRRASNHLKFW